MTCFLRNSLLMLCIGLAPCAFAVDETAPHTLMTRPVLPQGTGTMEDDSEVGYEESPPSPISVSDAASPPVDNFGILRDSVIAADSWKDSSRAEVDPLLNQLRSGVANDTLRGLLVKLLVSQAQPPKGTGPNWLDVRVNALLTLGQEDRLQELVKAVPDSVATPLVLQVKTELGLLHGDYDAVCSKHNANTPPQADIFWQEISILCSARAGRNDDVMLAMDVLNETAVEEPFFQELVRHILQKNSAVKSVPATLTLFDFIVTRMAGETDKLKDRVDTLPAISLAYLVQDGTLDAKFREKAAARAVTLGVSPPREGNKTPEPPFAKVLASDVTTLVTAFTSGSPVNEADNAVIARLALANAGAQDTRRIQRLLTLMEIFGYKVTPDIWQKLASHKSRFDGEVPPAYLLDRLNQASFAHRKGEVIVLAALIADGEDTDKMSDLVLIPIIKALKANGFEKAAREMAGNAVIGYK